MFSFNALIYSGVVLVLIKVIHGLVSKAGPYLERAGAWVAKFLEDRFHAHLPEWFVKVCRDSIPLLTSLADNYLTNKDMLTEVFKKLRQNKGNEVAGLLLDYAQKVDVGKIAESLPPELKNAINEARTDVVVDAHIAKVTASVAMLPEKLQDVALESIDRSKVKEAVKAEVAVQKVVPVTPKETLGRSDEMTATIEKLRASLPK